MPLNFEAFVSCIASLLKDKFPNATNEKWIEVIQALLNGLYEYSFGLGAFEILEEPATKQRKGCIVKGRKSKVQLKILYKAEEGDIIRSELICEDGETYPMKPFLVENFINEEKNVLTLKQKIPLFKGGIKGRNSSCHHLELMFPSCL